MSIKKLMNKLRPRHNKRLAKTYLIMAGLAVAMVIVLQQTSQPIIDPAAYRQLLDTIAKGESNGNYNAYFGNARNAAIKFTEMPISQVLQWQQNYVNQGSASSAVGRYQFLRSTLQGLVQRLGIHPQAKFDENLQDRLAIALAERRGALDYAQNRLTREQFAANLAKEWASLPKITGPNPEQSYYAKDGLNKAHISSTEIYTAIQKLKA